MNAASTPEDVDGSWSASPSPDGRRVAFVSDRTGEPEIWIQGPEPGRLSRLPAAGHRVLAVSWSPDGSWLAYSAAASGSSRDEVWLVRPDGTDLHLAAGAEPASAQLGTGAWHGWTADSRLMVTETFDQTCAAKLLDPAGGPGRTLATGPLLVLLDVAAQTGRALLRFGPRGSRRLVVVEPDGSGRQEVWTSAGPGTVDSGFLTPDGRTAYVRSDVGRELAALIRVPLDGGRPPELLAERPGAELELAVPAADASKALLLWNVDGGRSAITLLDLASGRQIPVAMPPRDVIDECRLWPDGRGVLLTAEDWAHPRGVWTVEFTSGAAAPLSGRVDSELHASRGASPARIGTADLTRPRLCRFGSHDGLPLTGWLYQPDDPGPWPTMIHLHGGPEAQERGVYNSLFQSLVAEGIAVFAPNVRGSSGFGRSFEAADDRERRHAAADDVAACVAHLVDTGVADPGRVGCMGRSYGGYLTLVALTRFPELFAVGVDVCGIADFETFYARTEPRIAAAAVGKYGDPVADAELLRELSPIHRIGELTAPLLIVHGADDTNVPVHEAEQVAAALAARGVEHQLIIFPGEGHELLATPNRVAFVRSAVDWVSRYLGVSAGVSDAECSAAGTR